MKKQSHTHKNEDNIWQIQEAKAKFSKLVDDATKKGFQTITKQGEPVAVILSKKEFDKLTKPKTTLLQFFKAAPYPDTELNIHRSKTTSRPLDL